MSGYSGGGILLPTLANNQFIPALKAGGSAANVIGIDTTDKIVVDPLGIGVRFGVSSLIGIEGLGTSSRLFVKAGSAQGTVRNIEVQHTDGTVQAWLSIVSGTGRLGLGSGGSNPLLRSNGPTLQALRQDTEGNGCNMAATQFKMEALGIVGWSAGTDSAAANDTGLSRVSAGVIGIGTGAQGSFAGVIKCAGIIATALPTVAGAAGTLYSNAGVVTVSP